MAPKDAALFEQTAADQAVIKSLLREINELTYLLGEEKTMSKVIQATDGNIYLVHNFELLDVSEAQDLLVDLKGDVAVLETAVASQQTTEEAPVEAPAAPEQPAEVPAEQPVAPEAPVEPAAEPAPAVDPNAVPASDPIVLQ